MSRHEIGKTLPAQYKSYKKEEKEGRGRGKAREKWEYHDKTNYLLNFDKLFVALKAYKE